MITKNKRIKKESRQNLFFSVLLAVVLFVIIGFLVASNWRMNQKRMELSEQAVQLREQIQALEIKRQQLQAQISQTSEESYLEEQAREQFNLKKPGEEVVTILPAEATGGGEEGQGFWAKLLDKLKFW